MDIREGEHASASHASAEQGRDRSPPLTCERVVAEALTVIAEDGVQALTMRTLAARLGVVPGALYHHVRDKKQLQDLTWDERTWTGGPE